ncbi:MAG: methyltransferase domain-containing protein [Bacilli bacterium]
MNEEELIKYYNKFNEDKRLNTKHGQLEFITAMKYIEEVIKNIKAPKILDIGAGTGKYSLSLANMGYDVTAVELVKHNLRVLQSKNSSVKSFLGNALDLSRFNDKSFNITLLFGPMYHLISEEDKVKALAEAARVTTDDGYIIISYCMNEYALLTYGFKENNIIDCLDNNMVDSDFHIVSKEKDLYSFVRLEDINKLNEKANLKRVKIISQDGPTEYMKSLVNNMSDDVYKVFLEYHLKTCEREELLGASRHLLDILKK